MLNRSNHTAIPGLPHHAAPSSRREFLARSGAGFGALAMAYMLAGNPARAADVLANGSASSAPRPSPLLAPLAPKAPHYAGKAKNVIFLFMEGGPSHIDLLDPK